MLAASGQARRGRACQIPPGSKDSNGKEVSLGAAGFLLGHFLWQNYPMRRWLPLLSAAAIGIALGLVYGWIISPVKFVDTTPASLRQDYKADYVLMVAEAFHADQNADLAARRLAIFGGEAPADIASQALQSGRQAGYTPNDLSLLQELTRAMQAYQPILTPIAGTQIP